MGDLQHNKTIVVDGPTAQSGRLRLDQLQLARLLRADQQRRRPARRRAGRRSSARRSTTTGRRPAAQFGDTPSAALDDARPDGIDAQVAFSPHATDNALLTTIARRHRRATPRRACSTRWRSCTRPGADPRRHQEGHRRQRRSSSTASPTRKVGGIDLQTPDGNVAPVIPAALDKNVPEPSSPSRPAAAARACTTSSSSSTSTSRRARVYLGSYNFSVAGRHRERREPAAHPRPPRRGVLHRSRRCGSSTTTNSASSQQDAKKAGEAAARQAAAAGGREAVVGRGLHRHPQDPRPRAVRVAGPMRPAIDMRFL